MKTEDCYEGAISMKSKPITYNGIVYQSLAYLSRVFKIDESTLRQRINTYGYTVKDAIELPLHNHHTIKRQRIPVEKKMTEIEIIRWYNKTWKKYHFMPNMNSHCGWIG